MLFNQKSVTSFLAFLLSFAIAATAYASEAELVSTMELMPGITSIDGIRVVPAEDVPGTVYTEDYAPSQVLEIIRPNQRPITVGRLATSCGCLRASMEKRNYDQGERAFIEVRNVKASPPQGATFAVFVQMISPYRSTLQYEHFTKSSRKPGDPIPETASAVVQSVESSAPAAALSNAKPVPTPTDPEGDVHFKYKDIVPYGARSAE